MKIPLLLYFATVSAKEFPLNNKWYQSLVRSFNQEKNNIQAQQKKKMVKSSSSSENEACCSKSCKKNTDSLNSKITDLSEKLGDRENMLYHYKLGLSQVKGLPEFADDTITDYSRPSPAIEIDSPTVVKTDKKETVRNPTVKYVELYKKTPKRSPMRTNRPNMNVAPRPNVNSARPKTTQDLMIILIQRVKRLERELKARTLPTKIHKVDRGRSMSVMAWVSKKV
nr:hypothetical protein [Tanacetum cinerariifolium]